MSESIVPEQENTTETLPEAELKGLSAKIQEAAGRAKWPSLSPVQARAIPYMLAGKDLMVQARTGSGKTGAFLLPMLEELDASQNVPQALVLVPTRELANQVAKDADVLLADSGLEVVAVYGGVGYKSQIEGFQRGAQVVVGTPGRVLDHLLKRNLKLDRIKMLVYDEADRMLSMGFYPDMLEVENYLPDRKLHRTMFSATFPPNVRRLAERFLNNAEFLSLSKDHVHVTDVEHVKMKVGRMDKDRTLVRLLEVDNPSQALIFCNTKQHVTYVATVLRRFGFNVAEMSSDLSQSSREKVLAQLKEGSLRFVVATDVAARGIDVHELGYVVLYDPPEDPELYIHRAGRTGRAGASGVAVSLIEGLEEREVKKIASIYKIDFEEREAPTDADVAAVVAERLTVQLEAQLRKRDKLKAERMQRFMPLAKELADTDEGRALLAMVLDDRYHEAMHEDESPIPEVENVKPHKDGGGGKKKSRRKDRRR